MQKYDFFLYFCKSDNKFFVTTLSIGSEPHTRTNTPCSTTA